MLLLLLLAPATMFAQTASPGNTDITGLWKGILYNDSTKQDYKYEIGISEDNGKLSGFTHTWYNDKDYFVVKKVKIRRTGDKVIIEDVDIIAYNYPESPPKAVRRLHNLTVETIDSVLILSGSFSTNPTKTYAAVTGTVRLQRKNDFWRQSDLLAHLQELGLENKLSFVVRDNELKKLEEEKSLTQQVMPVAVMSADKKRPTDFVVQTTSKKKVKLHPIADTKVTVAAKAATGKEPVLEIKPAAPAAEVKARKNIVQETMYFKTDSLELALYDNGEVDGDTVSVLMNGAVIMARQGLSTVAIRKTIYIPAGMDSVELVMYAETLGTLPPNSGLLLVRDGKETYEIRFTGDLQKNAAIIFKRKQK